jgi:hypothetical protein
LPAAESRLGSGGTGVNLVEESRRGTRRSRRTEANPTMEVDARRVSPR